MKLQRKNILIVGLARTGVALARFLAASGARVTVTDQAPAAALEESRLQILGLGVTEELGVPQPHNVAQYDLILLSPGVPPEVPWLAPARAAGIPIWGELELASHFLAIPTLAVSGTNGKTTTTTLLGEFLQASGLRPLVGGNIGTPLISLLPRQDQATHLVVEVSSFQLDTAPSFHPQAAALLNITPDHLDRHAGLEAYVASKAALFQNQTPADLAVLNYDDPLVRPLGRDCRGRVHYFSGADNLAEGARLSGDAVQIRLPSGLEASFPLKDILLPGRHNLENIMAALLLALEAGARAEACRAVLARFPGLPHRLQFVADVGGVRFFDDSKGTNVGAVARSLAFFAAPVILIAGGRDKDSDFNLLSALIRQHVKALVLLGETRDSLARLWEGLAPVFRAADMADAVRQAWNLARPGEVVLLSPACASFDMFRDYAHRGEVFQKSVQEVAHDRKN